MSRLDGKTCVVTGAGQGIGRAAVAAFLAEGAHVIAVDRQALALAELDQLDRVTTAVLDATDAAGVALLADSHRQTSVLLNCAGQVCEGSVLDCTPQDLQSSFQVNVFSMFNTIQAFLPAMRERRDGSIINIASVVSSVKAAPGRFAYGATKAAVIGLTKSVARDFITEGVRCNAISPGTVQSPSLEARMAASGDVVAAKAAFLARQPMGRLGAPEEIARVAVLLASDEARFMTGENIIIDGGMSL